MQCVVNFCKLCDRAIQIIQDRCNELHGIVRIVIEQQHQAEEVILPKTYNKPKEENKSMEEQSTQNTEIKLQPREPYFDAHTLFHIIECSRKGVLSLLTQNAPKECTKEAQYYRSDNQARTLFFQIYNNMASKFGGRNINDPKEELKIMHLIKDFQQNLQRVLSSYRFKDKTLISFLNFHKITSSVKKTLEENIMLQKFERELRKTEKRKNIVCEHDNHCAFDCMYYLPTIDLRLCFAHRFHISYTKFALDPAPVTLYKLPLKNSLKMLQQEGGLLLGNLKSIGWTFFNKFNNIVDEIFSNIKPLSITLENEILLNCYAETSYYENGYNAYRKSKNFYFSCLCSIFGSFIEGKENFVFPTPESYETHYKFMDIRFKLEVLSLIWRDTKADNIKNFENDPLNQKIFKYLETKFIYDPQLTKGIIDVPKEYLEVPQSNQSSKTCNVELLPTISERNRTGW